MNLFQFRNITKRFLALLMMACLLLSITGMPDVAQAAAKDTGTTNAKVNLRKSASQTSKALQSLDPGEEVDLLGTSGSWYKVRYGKYTGYIMKKYVDVKSGSTIANASKIEALGTPPGAMRIGDNNSDVKKLQQALDILGYYNDRIDGIYGDDTAKAVAKYQKENGLKADGIAGRATVKKLFGSCNSTSMNAELNGSAQSNQAASNTNTSSPNASKYNTVDSIAQIGSAPSPTREGNSGTNVVKLQQALECLGYYKGAIDGAYGKNTVAAVKKFQAKRGMNADGIAGKATIRVLFGSVASSSTSSSSSSSSSNSNKYKTETLDWFKDNVTSVIPKNARFTVKDVATGKTFEAVRWAGYNHLDVEPRTAEDAKTMKSIYGGSWSWRRRAILILYNGHVYAASMNGMPHGTDPIKGNGFAGHFCIHFKNSKTHGTKRVDSDHQNAVNRASRASW